MGFSRFKTTASTPAPTPAAPAPAPVPAPAPTPAPAPVVAATPVPATPAPAPQGFALTLPSTANVLAMVAKSAEEKGGGFELFPTLVIKGGNAGGTVSPSGGTPKEVGNLLPQGKQTIGGVYMACRVEAIAWPADFDQRGEGERPTINAAITCNDPVNNQLLLDACENFQFCGDKTKWDAANGGPGRLRPVFQMLVYLPTFDDLVVLQCPGLLKSWQTMSQILAGLADGQGQLIPFPAQFEPTTAPWYEQNSYHYFNISPQVNAQGKEWMGKYQQFVATLKDARPDLIEAVNDWFTGADKPLEGDSLAKLQQAASMKNPRRARK